MKAAFFQSERERLHRELFRSRAFSLNLNGVPSIADVGSKSSIAISQKFFSLIGNAETIKKLDGQTAGRLFEVCCHKFAEATFGSVQHLRPGKWHIEKLTAADRHGITRFEQYSHLSQLAELCNKIPDLAAALGQDYLISPDIIIYRDPEPDSEINKPRPIVSETVARLTGLRALNNKEPLLHATVSCKFTIRSDRAQNSRSEGLILLRNRKGRVPHIAVVTAEPMPARLASLALGTGDLDFVYHIALPELIQSIKHAGSEENLELIQNIIHGRRLRDIADLPLDLAI